jgi:alkylation response protein AidB-like acyl-CoA dehydrogenase
MAIFIKVDGMSAGQSAVKKIEILGIQGHARSVGSHALDERRLAFLHGLDADEVVVAHGTCKVTVARSTRAALRLGRFWLNVRVHTLHDPPDYKLRELGAWALNGRIRKPTFYS